MDKIEGVSGDIGDVGHLIPTVLWFARGWAGHAHSASYLIQDEEIAYILLAKAMAMTVVDLLWGNAGTAKGILGAYTPKMTKEEYLELLRGLFQEQEFAAK